MIQGEITERYAPVQLPLMKPYIYEVVLNKDGYASTMIFKGTLDACRERLKQINRLYGAWYHILVNDTTRKYLRDGYIVVIECSRDQEPKLNTKKSPK